MSPFLLFHRYNIPVHWTDYTSTLNTCRSQKVVEWSGRPERQLFRLHHSNCVALVVLDQVQVLLVQHLVPDWGHLDHQGLAIQFGHLIENFHFLMHLHLHLGPCPRYVRHSELLWPLDLKVLTSLFECAWTACKSGCYNNVLTYFYEQFWHFGPPIISVL